MTTLTRFRSSAWRSRWAAVGAAVAVTLGAGGIIAVNAAPSEPSSFVPIIPTRILDTRTDVGLAGPFVSGVAQTLQVTGTVPTQPPDNAAPVNAEVVPPAATSVVLNATVVAPLTKGFLSIRPGDATGTPATSNINWAASGPNIANSVTVQLPANGAINIFVNGTVGEVLIDVAGYYIDSSLSELANGLDAANSKIAALEAAKPFVVQTNGQTDISLAGPTSLVGGSLPITAPVDGFVTVDFSADVQTLGGPDTNFIFCGTVRDGSTLPTSFDASLDVPGFGTYGNNVFAGGTISGSTSLEIVAGETITMRIACGTSGASGAFLGWELQATFHPTDS